MTPFSVSSSALTITMKRIADSPCRIPLGERRPVVPTGADPVLPTRRTTRTRIDTTSRTFFRDLGVHAAGGRERRLPCSSAGRGRRMSDDGVTGGCAERLGARAQMADDVSAQLHFTAREEHLNQAGTVHGGVLATLVDTAMGQAVRRRTGEDDAPATSQLTVTYLRPGKPGHLRATGRVSTQGEHLTVCEADVEQDGRTLVHAVATFAVLHR